MTCIRAPEHPDLVARLPTPTTSAEKEKLQKMCSDLSWMINHDNYDCPAPSYTNTCSSADIDRVNQEVKAAEDEVKAMEAMEILDQVSFVDTDGDESTLCLTRGGLCWKAGNQVLIRHVDSLHYNAQLNTLTCPQPIVPSRNFMTGGNVWNELTAVLDGEQPDAVTELLVKIKSMCETGVPALELVNFE